MWKPINNFIGKYEVSSCGRVRNSKSKRVLKPARDKDGYLCVSLFIKKVEGKSIAKSLKVHRIVAEAFNPNPHNKPQVNHINGKKDDNNSSNLSWVTNKENIKHAYDTGLMKTKPVIVCNTHSGEEKIYPSINKAVEETGVHRVFVWKVMSGRQKSSKGYTFKYLEENK